MKYKVEAMRAVDTETGKPLTADKRGITKRVNTTKARTR